MIVVSQFNRRVRVDHKDNEPLIDKPSCAAVIALDAVDEHHKPFRATYYLTETEAAELDALCNKVAQRLIVDIANPEKPAALPDTPEVADAEQAAAATAATT